MVTNPVANLKLAVGGVFPYLAAREAGAQVALGTDGAGSNNSLDLLDDVKAFALIQKHVAADPAAVTAGEAWEIATGQRSKLVGGQPLAAGRAGGLRARAPRRARPSRSARSTPASSTRPTPPRSAVTVVGGRVVYRQGDRAELDEVLEHAREQAALSRLLADRVPGQAASRASPRARRSSRAPRGWRASRATAACSGGVPVRIRFTGTSSTLPESVRGTSAIAKTSSGTWRGEHCSRIRRPISRVSSSVELGALAQDDEQRHPALGAGPRDVDDERVGDLGQPRRRRGRSRWCPCALPERLMVESERP